MGTSMVSLAFTQKNLKLRGALLVVALAFLTQGAVPTRPQTHTRVLEALRRRLVVVEAVPVDEVQTNPRPVPVVEQEDEQAQVIRARMMERIGRNGGNLLAGINRRRHRNQNGAARQIQAEQEDNPEARNRREALRRVQEKRDAKEAGHLEGDKQLILAELKAAQLALKAAQLEVIRLERLQ